MQNFHSMLDHRIVEQSRWLQHAVFWFVSKFPHEIVAVLDWLKACMYYVAVSTLHATVNVTDLEHVELVCKAACL